MSLFSLDILDPSLSKRPSPSPRIPLQTLSNASTVVPSTPSKEPRKTEAPGPPRWNTPEFWVYGFAFLTVVPMMFYCAYDVSKGIFAKALGTKIVESNLNYSKYKALLSDGWIFGRKVVCATSITSLTIRITVMLNTPAFVTISSFFHFSL
jgi:protein-cysteine N-palmitoyltransferase HHAT